MIKMNYDSDQVSEAAARFIQPKQMKMLKRLSNLDVKYLAIAFAAGGMCFGVAIVLTFTYGSGPAAPVALAGVAVLGWVWWLSCKAHEAIVRELTDSLPDKLGLILKYDLFWKRYFPKIVLTSEKLALKERVEKSWWLRFWRTYKFPL
jgi:hypothetical protein